MSLFLKTGCDKPIFHVLDLKLKEMDFSKVMVNGEDRIQLIQT